nr:HAMP domain-containing sensor histidine kinase [Desulfogranum marinum]
MSFTQPQSEIVLKYFQDDAPILYFLLNEGGVVLSINKYCRKLLGANIVGDNFEELLVDFQQSFTLEKYIHKSDTHHLLHLNIPNSLPRSYLFTFRRVNDAILVFGKSDAEELELLRSELLRANQELNNLTRSLQKKNAQLAHLNSVKNQFLGMATHDLRKPISVILTYTEFLLDETSEQLNSEHTGFLNKIENSALFMKRLVNDFLDVSAIEAGHFHLNITQVNPAEILEKSLVSARIPASKKRVDLDVKIQTGLSQIPVDADKIEQVMSNLIGNAIEHAPLGTTVSVALQETENKILFSVEDRGDGMSREAIKKIFSPFSRSSSTKTGSEKSTGLGLTISRKIIDAHQGKIVAESEEGRGTCFIVYLNKK